MYLFATLRVARAETYFPSKLINHYSTAGYKPVSNYSWSLKSFSSQNQNSNNSNSPKSSPFSKIPITETPSNKVPFAPTQVFNDLEVEEYVNPKTGERGGPRGPEPTRFGDWEIKGRVSDF